MQSLLQALVLFQLFLVFFQLCPFLCLEQRKYLSKTFSHELVEMERFLGEIKGMTLKEGGDSNKSGKDKRDVRICIGRSGEGRNRGHLHKCNVLGTYPSAL